MKGPSESALVGLALALGLVSAGVPAQPVASVEELLRERVEAIRMDPETEIRGAPISAVHALPALYERRGFTLAWTAAGKPAQLFAAIRGAEADGLDPADYHLAILEKLRTEVERADSPPSLDLRVDYDLLLTDALARLGYHILFGKVDPERFEPDWNFAREIPNFDAAGALQDEIDSPDLGAAIERAKPQHRLYLGLKAALARYRKIRDEGGWQALPAGPALRVGSSDPRVPALRARLAVTGDLAPDAAGGPGEVYDETLAQGVTAFQGRHGLDADGVLGSRTIEELNVSVETRIDQLRVNLERGRWLLHDLGDEFVAVNIAGFWLYYMRGGEVAWRTRVQVGKPYRATPVFRSRITYLVFNPTWTVPPGILAHDILPAQKRDRSTLARKGLEVLDASGTPIPAESVDWDDVSAASFPYVLRQPPGPDNALGRVKFMFPNDHAVYLHDTPSKSLFEKEDRAFSSGCIRVEDPLHLAELLLAGQAGFTRADIERVVAAGTTRSVTLARPVPVWLVYWTAWSDLERRVEFRRDLYGRDVRVLEGLGGAFRIRQRGV